MGVRKQSYIEYYGALDDRVKRDLDESNSTYLLNVDPDEWLEELVRTFRLEPLELLEDETTIEPFVVKEPRPGMLFGVDRHRFRLRVPFSCKKLNDYFRYEPANLFDREPEWKLEGEQLIFELDTEVEIERTQQLVRESLGRRNAAIEHGNSGLRDRIAAVWQRKREELEAKRSEVEEVIQRLKIPLYRDPNSPSRPIEIKPRQLRTALDRPKSRSANAPAIAELDRDDVVGLIDFVEQYARQFEVAPKTYAQFSEEGLRDLLVSMMNANYPGSATGETFNKLGKTDISFRVDAGHVLVFECKFWDGRKAYDAAMEQLFGYLTWRQNYGVLVHFCKLKNMTRAVAEARAAATSHGTHVRGKLDRGSDTRFATRHSHPQDDAKSVEVHHLFLDLSC